MKNARLILISMTIVMAFAGCQHKKSNIQGEWIIAGTEATRPEGIYLCPNGQASSINQTYKQYTKWERHGSLLILSGKEFSEYDITNFADTVRIARLNATQLWTTRDSVLMKYNRQEH